MAKCNVHALLCINVHAHLSLNVHALLSLNVHALLSINASGGATAKDRGTDNRTGTLH